MISLLPITKVVSILCIIYAVMLSLVFFLSGGDLQNNIVQAFRYAAIYELIILALLTFGWRWIWKVIPVLNKWVFPDINGVWNVEIHWQWGDKEGVKEGKAHIKQDFLKISMEFLTDESESETLIVKPKKDPESGRPQIYYVYRNLPKNNGGNSSKPHTGAAILKFDPVDLSILEGNYFTDRNTKGMFKLQSSQST
ncbi:hypothetical protein [Salinivibrio sp. HTSP]|uniref:Cap15 family cyclic dinucleotide receptor domain-containing protein n=1 Tax=Salinivibrio sp. HTSP TaxID=2115977 RepID=UPI000E31431F|nr:hypothetical protein [Salinivibrio sp. HTSP]